jgi:DNA-binding CsgD family transcriptional regulator
LLSACDRAGDVERATEWLRIIRDLVLAPAGGRPRMLGAHCQLALGGVLCAVGQWTEAEVAVRVTLDPAVGSTASQRAQATARLAEMTIQKSRLDEAAELLAPIEDAVEAAGPLAQLHLARGEPQLALAVLLRAIPALGDDVLRRAELLALTVESGLAGGRSEPAALAADQLRSLAIQSDAPVVDGLADLADGLLAGSAGRTEDAAFHLDSARSAFTRTARPLLAAQASLAFADIVDSSADAVSAARAAHATAVRLGAVSLRDRSAAILRRHGVSSPRSTTSGTLPDLTARESDILAGLRRGDTNAQIAAQLFLSPKTVEHHVSRVLAKLGVRTRAEAAAVAAGADTHR